MRPIPLVTAALLVGASGPLAAQDMKLSAADTAAAFQAAGYTLQGTHWRACAEGTVSEVRDINGDGLPDVVISASGARCHGMAGEGYSLVSKQPNGTWKPVSGGTGGSPVPENRGQGLAGPAGRWPGFLFPRAALEWPGVHIAPARIRGQALQAVKAL